MNAFSLIAPICAGLGLFLIGVRYLSANLVPLVNHRMRERFGRALRGPFSSAVYGTLAGILAQNATAATWIILGLIRAGLTPTTWVLLAPAWANVGTALLPILVQTNLATYASYVIGLAGLAIYFRFDKSDLRRHAVNALLGLALLLWGMHVVTGSTGPLREILVADPFVAAALRSFWLLLGIGVVLTVATQAPAVSAALVVVAVHSGLIILPEGMPLIVGANLAAIINNILNTRGETAYGRIIFTLQAVQRTASSAFLAAVTAMAIWRPAEAVSLAWSVGHTASRQIAVVFAICQFSGALTVQLIGRPVAEWVARRNPPSESETLAKPVFLLRQALADPPVALDLALRELARLTIRLPQLLDRVRENPDDAAPTAATLRSTGLDLAEAIKTYLLNLLDLSPRRSLVTAALLLQSGTSNVSALNETLAEFASLAPQAEQLPPARGLVEALHTVMSLLADHAESLATEDPAFVLRLLGDRNAMMAKLRQRLNEDAGTPALDALFRMTILFERAVWLARRLITDMSQAQQTMRERAYASESADIAAERARDQPVQVSRADSGVRPVSS